MQIVNSDRRFIVQVEPVFLSVDPPILRITQVKPAVTQEAIASLEVEELIDLLRFSSEVAAILRKKGFVVRL